MSEFITFSIFKSMRSDIPRATGRNRKRGRSCFRQIPMRRAPLLSPSRLLSSPWALWGVQRRKFIIVGIFKPRRDENTRAMDMIRDRSENIF